MLSVENQTPYVTTSVPAVGRDAGLRLINVTAARFMLPPPGAAAERLQLAEEQRPAPLLDIYWGEPGTSSLRHEGQTAFSRPGTDLYIHGDAWTPGGRKTTRSVLAVSVGPCERGVVVCGDRHWRKGASGLVPSAPVPFESLPIRYERCFGGSPPEPSPAVAAHADLNPVGCGLFERAPQALEQPLPNFEDPHALIQSPLDRPRPAGLGPIPRHWQPRRRLAGTYDRAWRDQRVPFWPDDLDERYFCAGAPGLVTRSHLSGGEPVVLLGFSPDGAYRFHIPQISLTATFCFGHRKEKRPMVLDAISFEPDEGTFTMMWRASIAVTNKDALHHEVTKIHQHGTARPVAA